MHLGTLLSNKLDKIKEEDFIIGFFIVIIFAIILMLFAILFISGYNDIRKRNLDHKKNDIQITNIK